MSRERRILEYYSPNVIWQNKKLKQMTDVECTACLQYVQQHTGTLYIDPWYSYRAGN